MVTVLTTTNSLTEARAQEPRSAGLVATMGNLHAGHISLLERALTESEVVYFTIFVNPKQFGPREDFNKYPRTLEGDIALIEACVKKFSNRSVVVFAPKDPTEVFPPGYDQTIQVSSLNSIVEGALRPGHFDGVATVVFRLFELTKPSKAYFGLKDFQQYLVIKTFVRDLVLPIEIIGMPIMREDSGLALSSRNQYLTADQRIEGLSLSQGLEKVAATLKGQRSNVELAKGVVKEILRDERWNYLELRDAETLSEDLTHSRHITLLGVFQLGSTRLLDNMQLELT